MVAKISTGQSLYGALAYNQDKVDEGHARVLAANLVLQPEDGQFRIGDCMDDFRRWMPSHYRTEKPVIHISLNPHPDDVLTDEQLTAIGEEYMRKLGYGDQPYLIFKHEDIERRHIHIVSLRVDSNGRKINDSNEYRRSKAITEELEQKYGLHPAEGQKQGDDWQLTPVDSSKGNLKKQIANVVKPLLKMYRFQSVGEFRALLSLYNISMDEVKGEAGGRPYHGIVYSALDKDGEKTGTPIKSSVLGKATGIVAIENRCSSPPRQFATSSSKSVPAASFPPPCNAPGQSPLSAGNSPRRASTSCCAATKTTASMALPSSTTITGQS